MIGFLVHDERLFSASSAVGACHALRTYSYQHTEHMGSLRVHFFRNAWSNNYYLRDERYTICASGTMMFNNVHGVRALTSLRDALESGKELVNLFEQFQGPYTLILINRVSGQVSIVNSREGLRNCFLATLNESRAYSTNLLLIAALTCAGPCAEAIRQFIHLGATMDERTIFENVVRLSAASLDTYRNEKWTTSRLWRLETSTPDRSITRQKATNTVIESFTRNLEFTANIDSGRVAADLTGGTDSRTVLCCLMEKHAKPVVSTSGQDKFVDVRIARRIADKLGIEHYRYEPVSARMTHREIDRTVELADGNRDVITLAKLLPYYEEKARRFDFITGGAGGPLFKDHYWLFEFNRVGLKREPNWGRIARLSLVPYAIQDDFFSGFSDRIMDSATEMLRQRSAAVTGTNNQKLDFVYFDLKMPAFFGPEFSLTTQFMDVFHPMVDGENVQYSMNLPPEIRIRNILQFGMIQRLRPEVCWIPTDKGLPTVPPTGVNSWLRILRGRRYVETGFRKLRTALLGSSGQRTDVSIDIEELRGLGYFDLLEHSSLAASSVISASKLAEFKDSPTKQPNQQYLIATLSIQLFFERTRRLMDQAKRAAGRPSSVTA
jgi:Asparagine synthase